MGYAESAASARAAEEPRPEEAKEVALQKKVSVEAKEPGETSWDEGGTSWAEGVQREWPRRVERGVVFKSVRKRIETKVLRKENTFNIVI